MTVEPQQVSYIQKRRDTLIKFDLRTDFVDYDIRDKSGTAGFRVAYGALPHRVDERNYRNEWLRNVGLLWVIIGVILAVLRFSNDGTPFSIWLPVGLGCLLWYWLTIERYSALETPEGKILVLKDRQHDEIITELVNRRIAELKRRYAFIDHDNDKTSELNKLNWLVDNKVVTEEEFKLLKAELENPALLSDEGSTDRKYN